MARWILPALLPVVLSLPGNVPAADGGPALRINPFVQPVDETVSSAVQQDGDLLELRGIMYAGGHSLANIGGKIVGIGEEINGYRVIAVNEGSVVLEREGTRRELEVMTQNGVGRDAQAKRTR